ncbi:MAG: hypothetical protein NC452_15745 [Eubacterium sp.]|nr:hypothetical protein [Eubacterium sp.]
MSEQFLLDGTFNGDAEETIRGIIQFAVSETGYDGKYFSIEPNFKNKDTEKQKLIGYSILLDKTLFAKTNLDLSEITVKDSILHKDMVGIKSQTALKSPKNSTKVVFESVAHGIEFLKYATIEYAKNYIPSERFGCCHLYEKCSDDKGCIACDKFHAKGCYYRENLEKGLIFYGRNANI